MKWWIHAGMQYALANAPGGKRIYEYLQNNYGELKHLENSTRFDNATSILEMCQNYGITLHQARIVELGTGWIPVIPLTLAMHGGYVNTYDVNKLVKQEHFLKTCQVMKQKFKSDSHGNQAKVQFWKILDQAECFSSAMNELGGGYYAPVDTTALDLKSESVDLVVSNLVLQCIPEMVLENVLKETFRILKPGGKAIHRVRMSDEYARNDPQCHELDYLYYSDHIWKMFFTHRLKYLNRWRASQFVKLFGSCGFRISFYKGYIDSEFLRQVKIHRLAPKFRNLTGADLSTIAFEVILEKPLQSEVSVN